MSKKHCRSDYMHHLSNCWRRHHAHRANDDCSLNTTIRPGDVASADLAPFSVTPVIAHTTVNVRKRECTPGVLPPPDTRSPAPGASTSATSVNSAVLVVGAEAAPHPLVPSRGSAGLTSCGSGLSSSEWSVLAGTPPSEIVLARRRSVISQNHLANGTWGFRERCARQIEHRANTTEGETRTRAPSIPARLQVPAGV